MSENEEVVHRVAEAICGCSIGRQTCLPEGGCGVHLLAARRAIAALKDLPEEVLGNVRSRCDGFMECGEAEDHWNTAIDVILGREPAP